MNMQEFLDSQDLQPQERTAITLMVLSMLEQANKHYERLRKQDVCLTQNDVRLAFICCEKLYQNVEKK